MKNISGVANVIFDAAARRYEGQVLLSNAGTVQTYRVSAPGHPAWGPRRIRKALIASAQIHTAKAAEVSHARA